MQCHFCGAEDATVTTYPIIGELAACGPCDLIARKAATAVAHEQRPHVSAGVWNEVRALASAAN